MGKRNKGEQKDKNVKPKKKRPEKDTLVNDGIKEEMTSNKELSGIEKNEIVVFDNDNSSKGPPKTKKNEEKSTSSFKSSRTESTKSNDKNINNKTKQNKKIIFTDDNDEGTEVKKNIDRSIENHAIIRKRAEEEPGDEEIDKFCDELDEEDNVQYDNWIKLIETKLCPNKKK